MENKTVGDLKISGSGVAGGGVYGEVGISGSGKITGDIQCTSFNSSGSAKVEGGIKATSIKISGSGKIEGSMEAEEVKISGSARISGNVITREEMKVSGSAHIYGDVNGKHIKISGGTEVDGVLHGEEVRVSGSIHIQQDCEAEYFKSSGGFTIDGLLNGGTIDINLGGECTVKEIGAEKITVKRNIAPDSVFLKMISFLFTQKGHLCTDVIEGDEIYLEHTNAQVVRGNRIILGEGCDIKLVEYKEQFTPGQNSIVQEARQI